MKRLFAILLLLLVLLLVGCKAQNAPPTVQNAPPTAQDGSTSSSEPRLPSDGSVTQNGDASEQTAPVSGNDNENPGVNPNAPSSGSPGSQGAQPTYPAPTGEPWVSDVPIEKTEPVELDGLRFTSFGRYSGTYFEDGSDKAVEDVAVVLVVNTTERYLELATFSFEIDGASATFTVTNLPPQRGAWVLEKNALTVQGGASFVLKSGSTTFCTPEEVSTVTAQALDGTVMVENHSESESFSGYIYYKTVYEDGNYLGGVTYRSLIEDLPAQSRTEITAAHCDETAEIVRIVTTE